MKPLSFLINFCFYALPMASPVLSEDGNRFSGEFEIASGILPQLGVLFRFPDNLQLRDPVLASEPSEPYLRLLPIGANRVIEKGYSLPLPFGITIIGVDNTQAQGISDLSVALGKGTAPPFGTELRPIPNAAIKNVVSRTRTKQVKFDAWVLPFLNMFAAVGKVDGTVNLDVIADLDAALPPPICTPIAPCGTVSANFDAGVDAVTATIGATGVYSIGYWWTSATLSTTLTAGSNPDTDIKSYTGGGVLVDGLHLEMVIFCHPISASAIWTSIPS